MFSKLIVAATSAALLATASVAPVPTLGGVAEAAAPSIACRDGKDRRVRMINATSYTIERMYGSNVNRDSWEEDVLGQGVLRSGNSVMVNWDDNSCNCLFDFKAVFSDGDTAVRRRVNVCRIERFRFTE